MHIWLILMVGLSLGICSQAHAKGLPPRVVLSTDNQQQLREAQRLYEEGEKLWKEGKYKEAKKPLREALTIRERVLGLEHVEVAACLNRLGVSYAGLAQYDQAEALFQRALRIREVALGANHPDVAAVLNNLANAYREQGQYDRAELLHQRALHIREAALGVNHPDVATSLNNLGNAYKEQGQYDRAELLYLRALRISEAALGSNHPAVARYLNNLAILYKDEGHYSQAEDLYQRALHIREVTLGPNHPDVAGSLNNLATLYWYQGKYDQAEPIAQRALRISEVALGPDHPYVATSLENLASLYLSQGHYDRAEPLWLRALRTWKATLGANHPKVAGSLNNLAHLYTGQGQYALAESLYRRALRIRKVVLGPNHPDTADSLHALALVSLLQRKLTQALQHEYAAFSRSEKYLHSQGLVLSEERFTSMLASLRTGEEALYSMLLQNLNHQPLANLALSVALLRKGRTADEAAQFSRAVYCGLSDSDRQQFEQLRGLRSRFSSLSLAGPAKQELTVYRKQLEELDFRANAIEEDLARRSAPLRERRDFPRIDSVVKQVAMQLRPNSVLVELVAFHRLDFRLPKAKQSNELRYLAFIIDSNHRVKAVDLGMAKPIEDAAKQLHAALSDPAASYEAASHELFGKLMKPLLVELDHQTHLIVSPDGQLHLVPFDVLHDGKTLLGDRFRVSYVSSGRDLLPRELGREPATNVVVFADPDFEAHLSAPLETAIALGTSRGQRGLRPAYLAPLPGARKEAESLKQIVPSAQLLLGKEATEPALLGVSAPGILHIATHGLFADDSTSFSRSRSAHSHFEEDAAPPPNHPLLRSALAMAGALAYQAPADTQTSNHSDGLVTALELAGMNLWGTQLVVLSACNTGRGNMQLGQGVYGLRRALFTAGAETLVTSLWKVNDEATQELMTGYYQRLWAGAGRAAAMQKAAREMRQKRPHPYYWASFLVIGRSEPLHGT